jgi:hypothetical protein
MKLNKLSLAMILGLGALTMASCEGKLILCTSDALVYPTIELTNLLTYVLRRSGGWSVLWLGIRGHRSYTGST